jgi:hypothetical protein
MSGKNRPAHGDSSTGSELKAVEEACREASRTVEPFAPFKPLNLTESVPDDTRSGPDFWSPPLVSRPGQ